MARAEFADMVLEELQLQQGDNPIGYQRIRARDLNVLTCNNESDLLQYYRANDSQLFAALDLTEVGYLYPPQFINASIRVGIRFNQSFVPSSAYDRVTVDQAQCRSQTSPCNAWSYVDSGFIALQSAIVSAHANLLKMTKPSAPAPSRNATIGIRPFPTLPFTGFGWLFCDLHFFNYYYYQLN